MRQRTLLRCLASSWRRQRLRLCEIELAKVRVDRAAARALSKLHGLQRLKLEDCGLEDCSVIDIAVHLEPYLRKFDVSHNLQLTDACLPALASAVPGLQLESVWGCAGMTLDGMRQYLYASYYSDDDSDMSSDLDDSDSDSD
jgi:hypothetical protein